MEKTKQDKEKNDRLCTFRVRGQKKGPQIRRHFSRSENEDMRMRNYIGWDSLVAQC